MDMLRNLFSNIIINREKPDICGDIFYGERRKKYEKAIGFYKLSIV